MTIGSTTWHRPTILPMGARASSFAKEERHSLRDENTRDEAALTDLQTGASPWLHKSKTMTAAVDESMFEAPFSELQRQRNRFVSHFAKIPGSGWRLWLPGPLIPT
ncbi:hypothetical protein [Mesorhizobium sp.]|uniref:hypothetical protein n=1 Tax=Mesorhizobium sp. TaxID=1871066 RepID=UPI0025DE8E29|nr:hypothetical protein [Mesorhizobium sp.]